MNNNNTFNVNNPIFSPNDPIMAFMNEIKKQDEEEASFPNADEVEVFRISPEEGKYYYTATHTRKTGSYSQKNERYYTKNPLTYVGRYIETLRRGYGDNSQTWSIFDNYGEEVRVDFTYEGTTCFVETESPSEYILK